MSYENLKNSQSSPVVQLKCTINKHSSNRNIELEALEMPGIANSQLPGDLFTTRRYRTTATPQHLT